jgi:dTDP-4-amino-4,6-dideoxygalactose transaminase
MNISTSAITRIKLPSDQDSSGRTLGDEEIKLVAEAIESGTLTSTKGKFTKQFEQEFAKMLGMDSAYACSSGTAALHTAYAAIDPEPGDEFVTTSITDMGALTPILYQGAIPVFADVDPRTLNVTADSIESVISEKTKAIIVTHLFGQPCEMHEIMEVAKAKNIPVIEDCAQAFLAEYRGQPIGTIGDIGCFSLQQGKHITTGEGGVVVSDNEHLARRMFLFINKAWGYGDENPDHYFVALNYRMNDITGAVALAQLQKLDDSVQSRVKQAARLNSMLKNVDGIQTPVPAPGTIHTYWKYCLNVDGEKIDGGSDGLAKRLRDGYGIFSAPRYIRKPAFDCQIFREKRTFGNSQFPFTEARPEAIDYSPEKFPSTYAGLVSILVLPWNEAYTNEHVAYIANAVKRCATN